MNELTEPHKEKKKQFDLTVCLTTENEYSTEEVIVKIINALQDGNSWLVVSPNRDQEIIDRKQKEIDELKELLKPKEKTNTGVSKLTGLPTVRKKNKNHE